MKDIRKNVYTSIGMTTYAFIKGMPYSTELLRTQLTIVDNMYLISQIDENEYGYLVDLLNASIEFFSPVTQPTV